jgi:hypothetical protein
VRLFDFPSGAPNPSFTIAMRQVFISLNIQRHARKSSLQTRHGRLPGALNHGSKFARLTDRRYNIL